MDSLGQTLNTTCPSVSCIHLFAIILIEASVSLVGWIHHSIVIVSPAILSDADNQDVALANS